MKHSPNLTQAEGQSTVGFVEGLPLFVKVLAVVLFPLAIAAYCWGWRVAPVLGSAAVALLAFILGAAWKEMLRKRLDEAAATMAQRQREEEAQRFLKEFEAFVNRLRNKAERLNGVAYRPGGHNLNEYRLPVQETGQLFKELREVRISDSLEATR